MKKYQEFESANYEAIAGINHTCPQLENLKQLHDNVQNVIKDQYTRIDDQVKDYETNVKPNLPETLPYKTAMFTKEGEGENALYPYLNEAEKKIEYKDQYGNIKQYREYKEEKVSLDGFKEGDIIYVNGGE